MPFIQAHIAAGLTYAQKRRLSTKSSRSRPKPSARIPRSLTW